MGMSSGEDTQTMDEASAPSTRVTEYAIFERTKAGGWRMLASQSWYTDRWYGEGDDALTGIDAAWRALRRLREDVPGEYTVKAVRSFVRAAR